MKNNKKRNLLLSLILAAVCLAFLLYVDKFQHYSMLASVLKKGAIYSLVAVSLNLLNGFTGLFSLGQAGFMMLGAYTYAILTIPVASRASVYQYFDGGVVQFCLPMVVGLILAGIVPMIFAWLIGLPVLKLKSDYLAIATLGFAEIMRAIIQWKQVGPLTNASNLLRQFANFDSVLFPFIVSGICIGIMLLLINSTYGRAFKAIRDDEVAAEAMGINIIHFGLIICFNMMVGLSTPPFGMCLFITSGISGTPLKDIIKEIWWPIIVMLIVLAVITYIPDVVLFLPKLSGMMA